MQGLPNSWLEKSLGFLTMDRQDVWVPTGLSMSIARAKPRRTTLHHSLIRGTVWSVRNDNCEFSSRLKLIELVWVCEVVKLQLVLVPCRKLQACV